jgi:uncharacterized protein (TIGR02117 family)
MANCIGISSRDFFVRMGNHSKIQSASNKRTTMPADDTPILRDQSIELQPRDTIGTKPQKRKNRRQLFQKYIVRAMLVAILMLGSFWLTAFILGNTAINRDFQHAKNGVEIVLVNNGVHVDIVLPLDSRDFTWRDYLKTSHFRRVDSDHAYCMFGWGDRKFYMETATWNDLKASNVLFAFAGLGETVVHAQLCDDNDWPRDRSRRIRLSYDQYQKLCLFLMKTFKRSESGDLLAIKNAHYGFDDAFYEANGHYHLFRTCNVWVGQAMSESGVRVGYWTLTPEWLFACLPDPIENPPQQP